MHALGRNRAPLDHHHLPERRGHGNPGVDLGAVLDTVLRVSAMVESLPELAELDIRRIRVGPPGRGAVLLDAALLLADPIAGRVPLESTVDRS